jgi:hypothetical protein
MVTVMTPTIRAKYTKIIYTKCRMYKIHQKYRSFLLLTCMRRCNGTSVNASIHSYSEPRAQSQQSTHISRNSKPKIIPRPFFLIFKCFLVQREDPTMTHPFPRIKIHTRKIIHIYMSELMCVPSRVEATDELCFGSADSETLVTTDVLQSFHSHRTVVRTRDRS